MGAWRIRGKAVVLAALVYATTAAAATTVEPIARLYLEGGYDSNPLYNGQSSDLVSRVSPDAGLKLHDPLFNVVGTFGGEWLRYQRLAPGGVWNNRASLALDATPTRLTKAAGAIQLFETYDPAALAAVGVFHTGEERAFIVGARARLAVRADPLDAVAATYFERTVLFADHTGGSMHVPGVEALRHLDERLAFGGSYAYESFASYAPGGNSYASAHALRARAHYELERHLTLDASAGGALWLPAGPSALVPEAFAELLYSTRDLDLRADAGHGLGIGASAEPGLVDSVEFGFARRWGRSWFLKGDGGLWHSGAVPNMAAAVTGYAVEGEAGMILGGGLRLSLRGAHYGRTDTVAAMYSRSTVGLRLGWELQAR